MCVFLNSQSLRPTGWFEPLKKIRFVLKTQFVIRVV